MASGTKTWYFFSASGINFTGKIINLIETGKLDDILLNFKEDILLFSNFLYDLLYTNFNQYWVDKGITDFMKFNTILDEFMLKESHKYLNNSLIKISNNFY